MACLSIFGLYHNKLRSYKHTNHTTNHLITKKENTKVAKVAEDMPADAGAGGP